MFKKNIKIFVIFYAMVVNYGLYSAQEEMPRACFAKQTLPIIEKVSFCMYNSTFEGGTIIEFSEILGSYRWYKNYRSTTLEDLIKVRQEITSGLGRNIALLRPYSITKTLLLYSHFTGVIKMSIDILSPSLIRISDSIIHRKYFELDICRAIRQGESSSLVMDTLLIPSGWQRIKKKPVLYYLAPGKALKTLTIFELLMRAGLIPCELAS